VLLGSGAEGGDDVRIDFARAEGFGRRDLSKANETLVVETGRKSESGVSAGGTPLKATSRVTRTQEAFRLTRTQAFDDS
jgi:hypothetical protein